MDYAEYQYLKSVGGRPVARSGAFAANPDEAVEWNFGLLQPHHPDGLRLTPAYAGAAKEILLAVPDFRKATSVNDDVDAINLTSLWKHPEVVRALGREFLGFGQFTGSCVGAGGGNVQFTMAALEVVLKAEPERIYLPFWPLMYGRSRYYMGDRTRGEGSLESCWDKARADGVPDAAEPGLPRFYDEGGSVHVGGPNEMMWSDGDSKPLTDYLDRGRKHPIEKSFRVRNADEAWDAIGQLNVIGHGSMYGYNVVGAADDGIAVGRRGPRWSHKETILGRRLINGKRHFLNVNQWFYQRAKLVWIPEEDVDWIARDEMFAYAGLSGVPEDKLRWVDWTRMPV